MSGPHDCKQEEVISAISGDLTGVSKDIKILCASNAEMVLAMKEMTSTLTTHMLENKEHTVKIEYLAKNEEILFNRLRRLEDTKVPTLEKAVAEGQAKIEAATKDVTAAKLSLKEVKESGETTREIVDKLANWKNRIVGGLIVVGLLWSLVVAIGTRLLFKEG